MLGLLLAVLTVARADEYCRALALEGGGSMGAYQVGVLLAMTQSLPGPEIEWNVVTGISTGSLNAAGVSLFPMGQEAEMAQFLQNIWLALNGSSSVYEDWNILGAAYGILNEQGMYNTAPLRDTLKKLVSHPPMRNITVGTTNLDTAGFGNFNESLGMDIVEAVMCSAAPPLYFPPQNFQNYTWVDGGCTINLDVFSAVERCMDVVNDESLVIVDMIFCYGVGLPPMPSSLSVQEVMDRVSAVSNYDSNMWFIYNAMEAYPGVNFRFTFIPSETMPGGLVPLDFSKENLVSEIALGQSDVETLLQTGNHDPRQLALDWKQTRYNKARAFHR